MTRFLLFHWFSCLLLVGCAINAKQTTLPSEQEIVRDQLIVHADFLLPRHHRILDDLTARRLEISEELDLPISDEPIHIYLFEDEARFRDFMSRNQPEFPHRRAFFLKNDTRLMVYAYWGQRVAEDLRHEVTHGYLHAVVPNIPLWMDEGIAEYFEVERGSAGVNRPHVKLLAEAYRNSQWRPNLARLESLESTAALSQLDYAEAWLWVHFLLKTDAQTNSLIGKSLRECRVAGTMPPLSGKVIEYLPDWDAQLIGHLKQLADEM